ncbi:MAG: imidazole glycerol phosphate synthase subunit HisH [Gammaproteobacteria bacterium]|nr:MAG: imidazole glycerol phosphate synthase subunit HisH [Gammaproteobacteria bacterium]
MTASIVLVDSGGTNIGSVQYALRRLGVEARMSDDAAEIRAATHVILPGVGAAAPGMARLREARLIEVVRGLKQPVLGVCLGMQLLFERSEESDTPCLGLIPGRLRLFPQDTGLRVPHMGWNSLSMRAGSPLLRDIDDGAFAYFVHSYAAPLGDYTLASTDYGGAFSAVVRRDNFYGAQFHPERSAAVGATVLRNFLAL